MLENAAPDAAYSSVSVLQRLVAHGGAGAWKSWGSNPLERLPVWLALTTLGVVWVAGILRCVGGFHWLGIRWMKPAREELWPLLASGEPPIPWWVLRIFSSLAAFPCMFPQYLGLLWSTRELSTGPPMMLQLCLLTGAVILAMSIGRIGWLAALRRTQRYQVVVVSTLTVCACAMASSSLFIGLLGGGSGRSWIALVAVLVAVAASSATRPVEDAVADANVEWVEFGTPRTTSQRQQTLRDIPRTYRALGAIIQTLLISSGLELTARVAGDLSFLCVIAFAALATAVFYEQYVPHTIIEACPTSSAHSTPHPTPRAIDREPSSLRPRHRGKYSLASAHAVHCSLGPLAGPLFAIYAFQVLGVPIWLIGSSHAVALGSEAVVLYFEDNIDAIICDENLWFFGSFSAAVRLFFYTLVSVRNAVWLLPLIEVTYGMSTGLANLAGSRLLARHGCLACVSRSSKGPAGTLGDGGLVQAVGCTVWGLIWHFVGFRHTYMLGSIVGSVLAVTSGLVVRFCGKDDIESLEEVVVDSALPAVEST